MRAGVGSDERGEDHEGRREDGRGDGVTKGQKNLDMLGLRDGSIVEEWGRFRGSTTENLR